MSNEACCLDIVPTASNHDRPTRLADFSSLAEEQPLVRIGDSFAFVVTDPQGGELAVLEAAVRA